MDTISEKLNTVALEAHADAGVIAGLMQNTVRYPVELKIPVNGKQAVAVPTDGGGYAIKVCDDRPEIEVLDKPRRTRRQSVVVDTESLLREIARWKKAPTVLEVCGERFTITAVFNPATEESTGWGDHYVMCRCALSDDLAAWIDASKKSLTHDALADFLEEAPGIVDPARADLLTVVQEFRTSGGEEGSSKYDPKTGDFVVMWKSEKKSETVLPELIVQVKAFEREEAGLDLRVRLRPRVAGGKLTFEVRLSDFRDQLKEAWEVVVDKVEKDGRLPAGAGERVLWVG